MKIGPSAGNDGEVTFVFLNNGTEFFLFTWNHNASFLKIIMLLTSDHTPS